MLLISVRALILYTLLVVVMRLMRKRQIGQLQPFELVIVIVIAELAVIPMSNTGIPLLNGIVGILVLMAAQIVSPWSSYTANELAGSSAENLLS